MKQKTQKKLQRIVDTIVSSYAPNKVILFGSYIWGTASEDSDIDLFIIKESKESHFKRNLKVRKIIKGQLPIDVLVYTPKEVEERLSIGDLFIKDILKKGKLIYEQ